MLLLHLVQWQERYGDVNLTIDDFSKKKSAIRHNAFADFKLKRKTFDGRPASIW